MNLGVYITLLNDENLIEECWKRIYEVFPHVHVCDLGSTDCGAILAADLGAQVDICGRIKPEDYADWKNDMGRRHDFVLWIDADEWWPASALCEVSNQLAKGAPYVSGFWRNLRQSGGKLYASELVRRGRVAWDTNAYRVGRTWPREALQTIDGVTVGDSLPPNPGVFAWHGVLLERSSEPEDCLRAEKRMRREWQFRDLEWSEISPEKLY